MAPALIATPATPTPGAVDGGTVVEISLPSGALINDVVGGLNHYTMESGMEGRWDWTCCVGARLDYILFGSLRVRSEGQIQVLRAGQSRTWEEIPAGTEVSLETGDSLYSRMEDAFDVINDGETPVELLDGVLFKGTAADDPVPHERSGRRVWGYHDQDISLMPTPLPPGPLTLRLRRSTLAAGETLPPPSGAVMQLAVSLDEENLASTQHPGFEVRNLGEEPVDLYFLTLEPDAVGLETPASSIQ
jgi:hypothetical protein